MRRNFFEMLSNREFDPQKEFETLWHLFRDEKCTTANRQWMSVAEYINTFHFRDFPFRGSFTSLEALTEELEISSYFTVDVNKLLLFCELIIAVTPGYIIRDTRAREQIKTISGNIEYILEKTNHEIKVDEDKRSIIVEKNKSATLAAELVDDTTVAFDIIEYNHFALKGHLAEKKKLLVSIAAHIEPILKSKALQNAGYKKLESDTGFVLNNFHIRHNNKEGAKAQDYIKTLSDNELEEWYDHAYELMLSVIIINDYLAVGKELADLKTKYNWKT